MQIKDRFNEIFIEMCEDMEVSWYNVFGEENFMNKLKEALKRKFGNDILDSDVYWEWIEEVSNDI
jgi:hypothetical protein